MQRVVLSLLKAEFMFFQGLSLLLLFVGFWLGRKLLLAQQANAALSSELSRLRRRLHGGN